MLPARQFYIPQLLITITLAGLAISKLLLPFTIIGAGISGAFLVLTLVRNYFKKMTRVHSSSPPQNHAKVCKGAVLTPYLPPRPSDFNIQGGSIVSCPRDVLKKIIEFSGNVRSVGVNRDFWTSVTELKKCDSGAWQYAENLSWYNRLYKKKLSSPGFDILPPYRPPPHPSD